MVALAGPATGADPPDQRPFQAPEFRSPATSPWAATEGKVSLQWTGLPADQADRAAPASPLEFELQQSAHPTFAEARTRYRGPDEQSFISGLPAGNHWFRVRTRDAEGRTGPWSEAVEIRVQYPSKALVLSLMGLGLAVLTSLSLAVGLGHRRYHRPAGSNPVAHG